MYDKKMIGLVVALTFCLRGFAHEGHGVPGALPPAPHGGIVQEAAHTGKDVHAHTEEPELFFEVVYKDKEIRVYPLVLLPTNTTTFTAISPEKDLTKVNVKVEIPRTKKTEVVKVKSGSEFVSAAFDSKGANRFLVHIAAEHLKESKVAKVQVESN